MANYGYICGYDFNAALLGGFVKDIFVPEDFSGIEFSKEAMCAKVNRILKERLLDKAVRVTGVYENNKVMVPFGQVNGADDTHTALLIQIQELKPKVCEKHEPISEDWTVRDRVWSGNCEHCGVKIKAVWSWQGNERVE